MKRMSLNQKVDFICKRGIVKQLTINELSDFVIDETDFIELINKGKLCFSYEPNNLDNFPFTSYVQCVDSFSIFVENIYLAYQ